MITSIVMNGFQNNLAQYFSLMNRCTIRWFHSGWSKVKVMQVPGQPSNLMFDHIIIHVFSV